MKTNLFLTTAIIAVLSTPAMAEDNNNGWLDTMKQSVQSWFNNDSKQPSEVEAYLDEVTIAVPPMTGEEAAAIMPAAGDYIEETTEDMMMKQAPSDAAPGSMNYNNDETSSFDTEFTGTNGSVAALEDTMRADDLANIMPAAGDAEEVTDEAIVVAKDGADKAVEEAKDVAESMKLVTPEVMPEANPEAMVEKAATDAKEMANDMAKEVKPVEAAMDKAPAAEMTTEAPTMENAVMNAGEKVAEDAEKAMEDMAPAAGEAKDAMKEMMK